MQSSSSLYNKLELGAYYRGGSSLGKAFPWYLYLYRNLSCFCVWLYETIFQRRSPKFMMKYCPIYLSFKFKKVESVLCLKHPVFHNGSAMLCQFPVIDQELPPFLRLIPYTEMMPAV